MGLHIFQEFTDGVAVEKPNRQACCVGCDAEQIKIRVRRNAARIEIHRFAGKQRRNRAADVLLRIIAVVSPGIRAEQVLRRRIASLRPAENQRIANQAVVPAIRNQVIEHRSIGKGGILAHGRIQALLLSEGLESLRVEADQGRAAGLRPLHPLNGRMYLLRNRRLPRDQADGQRPLRIVVIVPLPGLPNRRVLLRKGAAIAKHEIGPGKDFVQMFPQRGMVCRPFRVPVPKEGHNCLRGRAVDAAQQFDMMLLGR